VKEEGSMAKAILHPSFGIIFSMSQHLRFHGGTLVLEGAPPGAVLPAPFRWVKGKPRCPACHYASLLPWLKAHGVRDRVPRWKSLHLELHDPREPHDYQREALAAWLATGGRGSVVLPTGAGKTLLAMHAIARLARSTLVIVPTIDLLHQWYAALCAAFPTMEIGVFYGLEKELRELTVSTYPSAWSHMGEFGDAFKLVIFDEVHHLPAPSWQEIALMSIAPHRLGLTATYPKPMETAGPLFGALGAPEGRSLDDLIGPLVYAKNVDDLSGIQLAEYRTIRIWIDLTPEERAVYDAAYSAYTGFVKASGLRESHGPGWWGEYTRRSAFDEGARQAKVAERQLRRLVANAQNKLRALDDLLKEHAHERILIFTEYTDLVYTLSRRHLLPTITHHTKAAERKAILDGFRTGTYRALLTSRALNEGVDVPEAKVAIILGGSASAQEYAQRLGRILRKRANKTALLYEVVARHTLEEGISQRRRRKARYTA
jgi:superfamily II DNA or RNA helicase